tara:strand:- start:2773 stop:3231 length:459 start_codon:yes stop_codon:yes gene_type:complete
MLSINNLQNEYITLNLYNTFSCFDIIQLSNLTKIEYRLYNINDNQLTNNTLELTKKGNTHNDILTIKYKLMSERSYFFTFVLHYTNKTITLFQNYQSHSFPENIDITIIKNKPIENESDSEQEEEEEEEEEDEEEDEEEEEEEEEDEEEDIN